jgi:hypothetical protein
MHLQKVCIIFALLLLVLLCMPRSEGFFYETHHQGPKREESEYVKQWRLHHPKY